MCSVWGDTSLSLCYESTGHTNPLEPLPLTSQQKHCSQEDHGYSQGNGEYHQNVELLVWLLHTYKKHTEEDTDHSALMKFKTACQCLIIIRLRLTGRLTPFTPVLVHLTRRRHPRSNPHAVGLTRIDLLHVEQRLSQLSGSLLLVQSIDAAQLTLIFLNLMSVRVHPCTCRHSVPALPGPVGIQSSRSLCWLGCGAKPMIPAGCCRWWLRRGSPVEEAPLWATHRHTHCDFKNHTFKIRLSHLNAVSHLSD